MRRHRVLDLAFTTTGFAALALQVVWQRVISIHGGVDLAASTTVVAAFMGGLGLGSWWGGRVASRLSPSGAVRAYALTTLGLAGFAAVSVSLLYDGYQLVAPAVESVTAKFLVHFALLAVPTTLMGMSLPLLARGVVGPGDNASAQVGRLYALNTAGAAAGAFVTTWWLIGNVGLRGTSWVAAGLEVVAAVSVLLVFGRQETAQVATDTAAAEPGPSATPWGWYALFATTGAVALSLEVVYFRLVDAIMRSNSYTFGHVLMMYLVLYAAGAAAAARRVRHLTSPGRAFLWAQLALGVTGAAGLVVLLNLPEAFGMRRLAESYFGSDGFLSGVAMPRSGREFARLSFAYGTAPLLVMGAPVFFMGASFPLVMAAVQRSADGVARRVGELQLANVAGNVVGSVVTGFVLIEALGTSGTLKLLCSVLGLAGVALAVMTPGRGRWLPMGATGVAIALVALVPGNTALWRALHSAPAEKFTVVEERSCVNAWVRMPWNEEVLYLNATSQNGWPYDDFHVLIGLLPSLMQEAPSESLAIGLGAGSTAWGMLQDPRVAQVRTVELCGGEIDLMRVLRDKGAAEPGQLLDDPRSTLHVGDGRQALLRLQKPVSVISVDTLRPNSASSGNVYSVEFYQLAKKRLTDTGIFTQWVPTARTLNGVKQVFPYVSTIEIPGNRGTFVLASRAPLTIDPVAVRARFEPAAARLDVEQRARFESLLRPEALVVHRQGEEVPPLPAEAVNTDLFPRDEYWLNDG